jgi:spermidine synthase
MQDIQYNAIPKALLDGGTAPESCGFTQAGWFYEENLGACRLGIRILEHLHQEQSPYQKLDVYQTAFLGKLLTLDDVIMFTERDEFVYHEMLTHLPLCSLEEPKDVLIIGGGDCGCLREILKHPGIKRVVQCDIDERVTRVCQKFFPWLDSAMADPRAELLFMDGVAYIESCGQDFDLIIIDSTDPKGPGVGLFLAEFYAKVARALKPEGVMVAQTESPHWDSAMVRAVHEQQRQAFKYVDAFCGSIPTYPSGYWSWSYASNQRRFDDTFQQDKAHAIPGCLYYNEGIHRAAFVLPNFVRMALAGNNPFAAFDEHVHTNQQEK